MKNLSLFILFTVVFIPFIFGREIKPENKQEKEIYSLIDKYVKAREEKDTVLLQQILSDDIDQLVSTGEWRIGKAASFKGMMQSSTSNPGKRTIKIEKIRLIDSACGIADARYEIKNQDGTVRKMWSTFIVVNKNGEWKITAIRNMLIPG
jgi:ketosteroid isomerase-like protein